MVLMNNNRWNIFSTYEQWPTSPRKTRVRVFRRRPSSRLSWRGHVRSMFTPSLRRCAYQIVAGRSAWLNRDPIAEKGGVNLYEFVKENPVNRNDPVGFCPCNDDFRSAWPSSPLDWWQRYLGWFRKPACLAKQTGCLTECLNRYNTGANSGCYEPCTKYCEAKELDCEIGGIQPTEPPPPINLF